MGVEKVGDAGVYVTPTISASLTPHTWSASECGVHSVEFMPLAVGSLFQRPSPLRHAVCPSLYCEDVPAEQERHPCSFYLNHRMLELRNLFFTRLIFHFEVLQPLTLPIFKGTTFKGRLGHALRDAQRQYEYCSYRCGMVMSEWPSQLFFRPRVPYAVARCLHTDPAISPPFVLEPPTTSQEHFEPHDVLSYALTFIGHTHNLIRLWIRAVEILCQQQGLGVRNERCGLRSVHDEQGNLIYEGATRRFCPIYASTYAEDFFAPRPPLSQLDLHFRTPLYLREPGEKGPARQFTEQHLRPLLHHLHHRLFILTQCYCRRPRHIDAQPTPDDIAPYDASAIHALLDDVRLAEASLEWQGWSYFHNRQKKRIEMGGLIGSIRLAGRLAPVLPLLELGTYLHLGKLNTAGFGSYRIEVPSA